MTPPQEPIKRHPGYHPYHPWSPYERQPPPRRDRVAPWDVICTIVVWVVLLVAAAAAAWLSLLFAFATDKCPTDGCPPVPFGIDAWIYPVTWGGIGLALAVAAIGPLVSIRRRWYMFVWPVVAIGMVVKSFLAGFAMTGFSARYWH